jgi:hypothetical protein
LGSSGSLQIMTPLLSASTSSFERSPYRTRIELGGDVDSEGGDPCDSPGRSETRFLKDWGGVW